MTITINRKIVTLALLLWLAGCKEINKDKPAPPLSDGQSDKVKLTDLENKPIHLKQLMGKTIFLNFWATWCKPCLQEMPSIQKAKDILKNENIIFLLASNESAGQIENFKKEYEYSFNYVRVENLEELNIMALPTTFIFNPRGELVFSEMGFRKWDDKKNIDLLINIAESNE
ncbi:MAG: TlpA family protein disulfide reductase [Chitinophagaceae bacterium]